MSGGLTHSLGPQNDPRQREAVSVVFSIAQLSPEFNPFLGSVTDWGQHIEAHPRASQG